MLRTLGALAVFCSLSWCGFHRAGWYVRRLKCLDAWRRAVLEGERMLCDLGESTPAFLERLCRDETLRPMARDCLDRLGREERLELAWTGALAEAAQPLTGEERCTVAALGAVIGRYDVAQQRPALAAAGRRLEEHMLQAEEEKRRLGRMWSVLGVSAGLLAVVMLY